MGTFSVGIRSKGVFGGSQPRSGFVCSQFCSFGLWLWWSDHKLFQISAQEERGKVLDWHLVFPEGSVLSQLTGWQSIAQVSLAMVN